MLGTQVLYRTDGRNGLVYDLPAVINCTRSSHPGDYPDGKRNPLVVPESDTHVHLTVYTPGGFGSIPLVEVSGEFIPTEEVDDSQYVGAVGFTPGSGTYVEHNVPFFNKPLSENHPDVPPRTWRYSLNSVEVRLKGLESNISNIGPLA